MILFFDSRCISMHITSLDDDDDDDRCGFTADLNDWCTIEHWRCSQAFHSVTLMSCSATRRHFNDKISIHLYFLYLCIFSILHASRSIHEKAVCLSVCPSVRQTRGLWQKWRKICL